jgi:hypothetical protein
VAAGCTGDACWGSGDGQRKMIDKIVKGQSLVKEAR